MDPDITLILALYLIFLSLSIYSSISFFRRNSPITSRLNLVLLLLLTCTVLLFTFVYNIFYTELKDFTLVVYLVVQIQAFFISINLSQKIVQKVKKKSKSQETSIPMYFLTILLSLIITLLFYYSVKVIDSANLLGNE